MYPYLNLMGIDRWTLREKKVSMLPACYAFELFHNAQRVGLLLAVSVEDAVVSELLEKMIAALKCEPKGQWHPVQPDFSALTDLRFVITLGDGLKVKNAVPHLHSYAPQCLIEQPQLKAETWKILQQAFPLMEI